jgi:hypothetical protein
LSDRHADLIAALHTALPLGKGNPDKRVIQCPAAGHPDEDPSAHYSIEPDGTVLLKCWSRECSFEDMLDGLGGFESRDAFAPGNQRPNGHAPSQPKPRAEKLAPLPEPDHWQVTTSWEARYVVSADVPGPRHVRQEGRNTDGSPVMDPRKGKVRKQVWWKPIGTRVNDLALYRSWELETDGKVARQLVVCEGEKATDAVVAAGFPAVGTYGTSYAPSEAALEPLRGREVVLWPDADAQGREHMDGLARRLTGIASSVRTVSLPADVALGWDAADADAATIARLIAGVETSAWTSGRATALAGCVETFRTWMHMPDPGGLITVIAVVAANRAAGDPVWILLVGPPGGGKTETLGPLAQLSDVHPTATLTEAALLSGTPKRDHAQAAKGGLLKQIGDFGIIVCKDFGSVLSMNRDARASVLAALREIYDGSWTRHVGTDGGRTLEWSGKVGLIAGCTPAIDSHHAVIGAMGERFVLYRLPPTDADAQVRRALSHVGHEAAMRRELSEAVQKVLSSVDTGQLVALADEATTERLVTIATLAVRCRSAVERDSYSREVQLIPEAEAPARLALVLLRLLNGMLAIGVDEPTAWQLVTKCALDSMPALRRSVLEDLMRRTGPASTTEVAERVRYPTTTARRALEDLAAHGIVVRQAQGQGRADLWQASAWARGRWPTVPEKSEASVAVPGSVPEKSEGTNAEHGIEGDSPPITPPLRIYNNFSGTPLWDPEMATDDDAEFVGATGVVA